VSKLPSLETLPDETDVMRFCAQFSAVFSESSKVLFGSATLGPLLIEFFDRGGLKSVKVMITWLVRYLNLLESQSPRKSITLCKNI